MTSEKGPSQQAEVKPPRGCGVSPRGARGLAWELSRCVTVTLRRRCGAVVLWCCCLVLPRVCGAALLPLTADRAPTHRRTPRTPLYTHVQAQTHTGTDTLRH